MKKEIQKEINRCKELLKEYEAIPEGVFGAVMIRASISSAEKCIQEGNTPPISIMKKVLKELQEIEG